MLLLRVGTLVLWPHATAESSLVSLYLPCAASMQRKERAYPIRLAPGMALRPRSAREWKSQKLATDVFKNVKSVQTVSS